MSGRAPRRDPQEPRPARVGAGMRSFLPFIIALAVAALAAPAGAAPSTPTGDYPCGVVLPGGAHVDAPWLCGVLEQIEP